MGAQEKWKAGKHSLPFFSLFFPLFISSLSLVFPMYRQICPRLFDARHAHRSSPSVRHYGDCFDLPLSVLPSTRYYSGIYT